MLRHTRFIARHSTVRHASTTSKATEAASNTASKAKDSASNATSQASQGLSRVTSSAGPALSGAARGVSNALSRIGGRTGRLIAFVESMIPPTIYYSKVTFELSKIVFQSQKMSPPNLAAFQSYLRPILSMARYPSSFLSQTASHAGSMSPAKFLSQIRNADRTQLAYVGVVTAECLGFFTVGEILGKFKVVGYRGDREHHETATPHEAL